MSVPSQPVIEIPIFESPKSVRNKNLKRQIKINNDMNYTNFATKGQPQKVDKGKLNRIYFSTQRLHNLNKTATKNNSKILNDSGISKE